MTVPRRIGRRAFATGAAAGLVSGLGGCGFHPLYAPAGDPSGVMQSVYVDIIANRNGQLLRQALQQRLEGTDSTVEKRFVLKVTFYEASESIGIQTNSTQTRQRDTGHAGWVLQRAEPPERKLTYGMVRALDGYDILNDQFFYSELAEEGVERRLADNMADQIVQALAVYFRTHPNLG
jgi:LPS-assembly lipoprotein